LRDEALVSAISFPAAMTNYFKLPIWADQNHVYAVVDFDPKLGAFTLAKPLFVGLTYPYDWGFIPSTQADDGDPLDVSSFTTPRPIQVSCSGAFRWAGSKSSNRRRASGNGTTACLWRPISVRGRPAGHLAITCRSHQRAGGVL
jgi:hypothetical protein